MCSRLLQFRSHHRMAKYTLGNNCNCTYHIWAAYEFCQPCVPEACYRICLNALYSITVFHVCCLFFWMSVCRSRLYLFWKWNQRDTMHLHELHKYFWSMEIFSSLQFPKMPVQPPCLKKHQAWMTIGNLDVSWTENRKHNLRYRFIIYSMSCYSLKRVSCFF